ncbi:hypothetical protein ACQ4WX_45380 [Streptomyces lasalocidi]
MTEFNVLGDNTQWRQDFERRRRASCTAVGLDAAAGERMLGGVCAGIGDWTVAEITDAGVRVGHVAVHVADSRGELAGRICDLRVDQHHARPGARTGGPGLGRAVVRTARRTCGWTYRSPNPQATCSTVTACAPSSGCGGSTPRRSRSTASPRGR